MEQKTIHINIYNFIRMSHTEPSRFIWDDFETLRKEILTVKQFGFPGTYALKYDALMEPRYRALLAEWLDENDEISAWWEITRELCRRSGVRFRDESLEDHYDDRVNSAYCLGYTPRERRALVDGYMADFHAAFGYYPSTIGSWVLDSVTMDYAAQRYGVVGFAVCRDQLGVDGFTLWGGYPNGAYYPSRENENIPAQHRDNQLNVPVFRLLGPDPIYNFEAEARDGLPGVYTLEPSWLTGRDPKWLRWFFGSLINEDTIGPGYAQVGQENNFLWENIAPGLAPQLALLRALPNVRVETLAASAQWFRGTYRLTPPMTFQASKDWREDLCCQWYACARYRVGFLGEGGHLRIRDLFLYDEAYPSRYLDKPMKSTASLQDALPVLSPQLWKRNPRPWIRLVDENGMEPIGTVRFRSLNPLSAQASLDTQGRQITFTMTPGSIRLEGGCSLTLDTLPVFSHVEGNRIHMRHGSFPYSLQVLRGKILGLGTDGGEIAPEEGAILLSLGAEPKPEDIFTGIPLPAPDMVCNPRKIPAFPPELTPRDAVFPWGSPGVVSITAAETGSIRYTLDGSDPGEDAPLYTAPLTIHRDCIVSARLFPEDRESSEVSRCAYRFGLKDLVLRSSTPLDPRPVFQGNGIGDLLGTRRGSLDYLDGRWRGTLQDLDILATLPALQAIGSIGIGFLSHHRSGIVFPKEVALYTGPDADHLTLRELRTLPEGPHEREIVKTDVEFRVDETIGAFRILTRRHEKMPQWCAYRGSEAVFTMADSLIVVPAEEGFAQ